MCKWRKKDNCKNEGGCVDQGRNYKFIGEIYRGDSLGRKGLSDWCQWWLGIGNLKTNANDYWILSVSENWTWFTLCALVDAWNIMTDQCI